MASDNENYKEDFDYIEKLVIKYCLENEQYLATVIKYLKPEQFSDKNNRLLIKLLNFYFTNYNKKPTHSELKVFLSSDKLSEAYAAIQKNNKAIDGNIDYDILLGHTEKFLKIKSFEKALLEIASRWDSVNDRDDIISFYNQIESIIGYNLKSSEGHNYFEDIEKYIEYLTTEHRYILSGLSWLDKKLGGGFLQSGRALYLFAGETNVGKSIFLHNVAINAMKQNKKVLLFSLEMSEQMYNSRITSTLSNLDFNSLSDSIDQIKKGAERFKLTHPGADLVIKEYPPKSISTAVIKNYVRHLIATKDYKPDIIIIDYLNLVVGDGTNSYERVKDVSEQIRALSYFFECPLVSATQLNRTGYSGAGSSTQTQIYDKNGPSLTSISESYGTGATADAIFGLFRTEEDKEDDALHICTMKNRFGENIGTTRVGVNYRTMTLFEDEDLNNNEINEIEADAGNYTN